MQVIRCERSLQEERQQLRAQRDEAALAVQKHQDAMRQMGGRVAAAADAAAAAESRAQACEREAAVRALQDESIMRGASTARHAAVCARTHVSFSDVRSSMASQLQTLTSKLAESQRALELQLQADRERDTVACAAAATSAAAQREWFVLLTNIANDLAVAVAAEAPNAGEARATQQVGPLSNAAADCAFLYRLHHLQ